MIATNAFGMGIDKSNVRYVIHYNMPQSLENYYQEAGRAGRDGEASECILLYSPQDVMINRFLLESKEQNTDYTAEEMAAIRVRDEERLQMMIYYCMTSNCLREYILHYFGEMGACECQNCSNCLKEFEEVDVTEETGKIISCIRETGQRYGINVIAGILAGDDRAKLREYGVSRFQSYGSLNGKTEAEIKQIIQQLVMEKMLVLTPDKYALLKLTQTADDFLQGNRTLVLRKAKEDPEKAEAVLERGKRTGIAKRRSDLLNSRGLELFEKLRGLRAEIAREESMPPYIIFSDKTLTDMCIQVPLQKDEMLKVTGVGENKFAKYGDRFLKVIKDYTGGEKEKLYFGEAGDVLSNSSEKSIRAKKESVKKAEFYLTAEQAEEFPYAEAYLVTEIAEKLNGLREGGLVKKISGAEIYRRMQAKEYVSEKFTDGIWKKEVSKKGEEAGLFLGVRVSKKGTEYMDVYYNRDAQKMIVDSFIQKN